MDQFLCFILGISVTLNLLVVFLLILKKEKITLFKTKIIRSEDNFSKNWESFWR